MSARTSPRWPLLCAVTAVLVYLRALGNGFALDDVRLVESNMSIASLAHVPKLFLEPYWNIAGENYGLYRPMTVASLAVNRAVSGAGPFGFHAVNVLMHAVIAALAWLALKQAGKLYGTALLGGLLFAVLPVHTEVIANVAGRAELLAAGFVLAAWIAHGRARDAEASAAPWALTAALFYLAALLSKESTVLAPLLYFADDAMRDRPHGSRRRWLFAGYAMALATMLLLRALALGAHQMAEATIPLDNPAAAAGTWPRVATALWVQLKYALLCVAPTRLVSDYSFDSIPIVRSFTDPRAIAGFVFVAALAVAVGWGWKHCRPVALAALCWALFFLPSSNLLFPAGTVMAERLAYLPSLGLCLALAHGGAALASTRSRRIAVATSASVVIACFSARSFVRIPAWKDNLTLALTDVATEPRSAKLQAGAGMFLAEAGRVDEAEDHLRRAVTIYPDFAQMHYNLAVLLAQRGAVDESVEHLHRAIALAPGNPRPRLLLNQLKRR